MVIIVEYEVGLHYGHFVGCDGPATGLIQLQIAKLGSWEVAEWVKPRHAVGWIDFLKRPEQHRLTGLVGADKDRFLRFDIEPSAVSNTPVLLHPGFL